MLRSFTRLRHWLLPLVLLAVVTLIGTTPAKAEAFTVAALAGVGAGLLTGLAPVATTLLTSGLMWVANTGLGLIAGWSNTAKYAALSVIGVVVSTLIGAIGGSVSIDPTTWGASTAQGIAGAVVAALIYKLGQKG